MSDVPSVAEIYALTEAHMEHTASCLRQPMTDQEELREMSLRVWGYENTLTMLVGTTEGQLPENLATAARLSEEVICLKGLLDAQKKASPPKAPEEIHAYCEFCLESEVDGVTLRYCKRCKNTACSECWGGDDHKDVHREMNRA